MKIRTSSKSIFASKLTLTERNNIFTLFKGVLLDGDFVWHSKLGRIRISPKVKGNWHDRQNFLECLAGAIEACGDKEFYAKLGLVSERLREDGLITVITRVVSEDPYKTEEGISKEHNDLVRNTTFSEIAKENTLNFEQLPLL